MAAARTAAALLAPVASSIDPENTDAEPDIPGASTRAQIADTDEAVLLFAVTTRQPDRDVHPGDLAWWIAREERLEIRAELAGQRPALTA